MINSISTFNCSLSKKEILKANKILKNGNIIDGKKISIFEKKFSKILNIKHVLTVSDLSSAIYLILKNLNLKKNDEILTFSFNCLSSTSAITKAGLKPVWCDIKENYPSLDLEKCQKLISKRTKVLLLYYVAGYVQNPVEIKRFCKKNNLIFIEDVNCSIGSTYKKQQLGKFGDYSVYSFYPNRILSTINGGAISFPNISKLNEIKKEINYGIKKSK